MSTIAITEDQLFDAMWQTITAILPGADVEKGFQNMTSQPPAGSYIRVSPGVRRAQNQGLRRYDAPGELQIAGKHWTYDYQVDCYGELGPVWADALAAAWNAPWATDYAEFNGLPFAPLYADDAQQLNILNGENMYEQRFMTRLYVQVNQEVALPQDFFDAPGGVVVHPPTDLSPV